MSTSLKLIPHMFFLISWKIFNCLQMDINAKANPKFVVLFTLERISNWPPSICFILGKVVGKIKQITK